MSTIQGHVITVTYDSAILSVPWRAALINPDLMPSQLLCYRGVNVSGALRGLTDLIRKLLKWDEGTIATLIAHAAVQRDTIPSSFDASPDYTNLMGDENDNDDIGDALPMGGRRVRLRCEKCNIGGAKYANGDATNIADRADRFGILRKLCYLCGLREQMEKLDAEKRSGAVAIRYDFDALLVPGDLVAHHALGVALEGELPELTPTLRAELIHEYERSY